MPSLCGSSRTNIAAFPRDRDTSDTEAQPSIWGFDFTLNGCAMMEGPLKTLQVLWRAEPGHYETVISVAMLHTSRNVTRHVRLWAVTFDHDLDYVTRKTFVTVGTVWVLHKWRFFPCLLLSVLVGEYVMYFICHFLCSKDSTFACVKKIKNKMYQGVFPCTVIIWYASLYCDYMVCTVQGKTPIERIWWQINTTHLWRWRGRTKIG